MKKNEIFFSKMIPVVTVFGSLCLICDFANAATRATNSRSVPSTRKNISTTVPVQTTTQKIEADLVEDVVTPTIEEQPEILEPESELILSNKSSQFEDVVSAVMETAVPDNSFAEEIRRQRAALAASESSYLTNTAQSKALSTGVSSCDVALRKCMMQSCGKDFTKCATDGDTMFGEKLNRCRRDTECSAQEFTAFGNEIKADRDVNVKLASYDAVINCGNSYNACIVNECGTTYNKCLGKTAQDAAVQKCAVIAKECIESDSGLSARFGVAIGKLRENAEKDVKSDESRLYALRDMMAKQCNALGASFDERSFDCVYSIEFYVGENQSVPLASRMAYAGDSFVCTQEWFGINTTTTMENAYRETRAQTGASSAMLGSGLGTAAGLISSGAINRALDTQKAKKAYKEDCEKQPGKVWKNGDCIDAEQGDTETSYYQNNPNQGSQNDTFDQQKAQNQPRGKTEKQEKSKDKKTKEEKLKEAEKYSPDEKIKNTVSSIKDSLDKGKNPILQLKVNNAINNANEKANSGSNSSGNK